eukprot:CAMPEP_0197190550 /NCGR_PEP_ID=MMETSP1423-20130617/21860_1 /TAXON_ID=476441 /ORGANISM="Pseudo-nitzschia heimii, Strain UNC1101" /LENGTH=801 /DNA_ID=CAMNT_0042642951 /DNA_START=6 /DNA_END=2411 /DNA_ORIENTATION=+
MTSEDVIELSVEETNKLRAKLGLKPLRLGNKTSVVEGEANTFGKSSLEDDNKREDEALELSVDETNKLREKLGLAPLRISESAGNKNKDIHKPAENIGHQEEVSQRIEQAKLRRQVEDGATQVFGSSTLGHDDEIEKKETGNEASLSWAEKMRQQAKVPSNRKHTKNERQNLKQFKTEERTYNEGDLEGMQVRNSMTGLEVGENAVLTLADTSILNTKTSVSKKVIGINEEEDALENIKLTEKEKEQDGLRKKRMLEMGMGRAGGYAGFDDDEFEELGGTLGHSSQNRGKSSSDAQKSRGFRIGSQMTSAEDASRMDFDKVMKGESISLVWREDVVTSDYMTKEEELQLKPKKSKKATKFKKKKKKKDKKRRRRTNSENEEDEGANDITMQIEGAIPEADLLSKLENSADANQSTSLQKRRRTDDIDNDDEVLPLSNTSIANTEKSISYQPQPLTNRAKYDQIMEKGNARTKKAFSIDKIVENRGNMETEEDELDDSFLNAALEKARRLNRLRELNKASSTGADAVAEAVKSTSVESQNSKSSSGISFSIDDTREFSRAIRARTEQKERKSKKENQQVTTPIAVTSQQDIQTPAETTDGMFEENIKQEDSQTDEVIQDEDMEKLAKEVHNQRVQNGFDGSTADSVGVGRGLSSFVSMLKTTGEITGKRGGKEELRGRAKDERNYDNFEPLDLSKVVSIGRNATSIDQELANREVKLEYRDGHGRLLTQKEAYRDLCYQFHGHGASKRKEEKRLKQIAREQAEARMASRQVSAARDGTTAGTLGALKATQKATGKAFIVHKT